MIAQAFVFRHGPIRHAVTAIGMVTTHVRDIVATPMVGMLAGGRLTRSHRRHGTRTGNARQCDSGCQEGHQDCLPIVH